MWHLLTPLKRYINVKNINSTNNVFKLHSKITVYMLIFATVLLSAKQYFGDPIDCIVGSQRISKGTIDNWCWIMGAWIPKNMSRYMHSGRDVILQGRNIPATFAESDKHYLNWYQWVVFILVAQAASFILPSIIWNAWEHGLMRSICNEFASALVSESWSPAKRQRLANIFNGGYSLSHKIYAARFYVCELLNFIVVILNILFINIVFTGFWQNYKPAIDALFTSTWDEWQILNSQTFPKWAKCDFQYVGPSGTESKIDALCFLPLNIVNEKVFALFWFWYLILACISGINIIYRTTIICFSSIRSLLMIAQFRPLPYKQSRKILRHCNYGDCFVLYQMGKNLNAIVYRDILSEIADSIEDEPEDKENRQENLKRSSESITI